MMAEKTVPRPIVEEAVTAAFGSTAKVIGHKTQTLTAPGDNFATTVVCLQVELETLADTSKTTSESGDTKSEKGIAQDTKVQLGVDSTNIGKKEHPGASDSLQSKDQINPLGTVDFISKTDNGTDSIHEKGADNSMSTKTWTCIAKTNSKKESVFFKIFSKFAFDNEIRFYKTLLPALNKELSKSKASSLKVSKCYYWNKAVENELIIMEDLRRNGFTMGNKCRGLDSHRCKEVAKELARLHSASVLIRRNHSKQENSTSSNIQSNESNGNASENKTVVSRFEAYDWITGESYLVKDGPILNIFAGLIQARITSALDLFSKIQGTEKEVSWLKSIESDIPSFLRRMLVECKPEFLVLCHGDTWSNNFLFSSNLDAVSIVDFQIIRPASLATDLNYLFYTSHIGYFSPIHLDTILDAYYAEFAAILGAQGYQMPFNRKGLSAEVEAKKPWGVMGGVLTLPMIFPQQQGEEDRSTSSNREKGEKTGNTENKVNANDAEADRNEKESASDQASRSIIQETRVDNHDDSGAKQETSTSANVKENAVAEVIEVPCKSSFEEKFIQLFSNITL